MAENNAKSECTNETILGPIIELAIVCRVCNSVCMCEIERERRREKTQTEGKERLGSLCMLLSFPIRFPNASRELVVS